MQRDLEIQGHRGARGLAAENTLAGFEIALDLGVTSIETDVHLTRDDVPILFHDPLLEVTPIRSMALAQLRAHRVAGPVHGPTPVADRLAGGEIHGVPTLMEFLAFVQEYANDLGKSEAQRHGASQLIFDIEIKRVPFEPVDDFDGRNPGVLEHVVVEALHHAGVLARSRVRSFDHRSVRAIKHLAPTLETGILVDWSAPVDVAGLLAAAQAEVYCPNYHFVDAEIVGQVHAVGKRIIPYTVNEFALWQRLIAWGVDGITTDFPTLFVQRDRE